MAIWQANNIQTGTPEGPKYIQATDLSEVWRVSLPTSLANGDTIIGPTLPFNCYLLSVRADVTSLDSGAGITFTVGYAGFPAAFISTSTAGQGAGGIAALNVPGTIGFNQAVAGVNTQIIVTFTHAATVPVAGTVTIALSYTASP